MLLGLLAVCKSETKYAYLKVHVKAHMAGKGHGHYVSQTQTERIDSGHASQYSLAVASSHARLSYIFPFFLYLKKTLFLSSSGQQKKVNVSAHVSRRVM